MLMNVYIERTTRLAPKGTQDTQAGKREAHSSKAAPVREGGTPDCFASFGAQTDSFEAPLMGSLYAADKRL